MTMPAATSLAAIKAPPHHGGAWSCSITGALWTLFTLSLRQHVRGKRWMVMGVLFLLPAGLAILIRTTAGEVPNVVPEFLLAWMFIPQILLPLVALVYASGIIQDEQEEQTITYLLMRPMPKWAIYLVKLAATLTTTVLLVALFTTVTYAAVYVGSGVDAATVRERCLNTIAIHSLAVVAYCCLFGLMSIVIKRTLVIGILYIAVVEGVLANMPFGIRLGTVIYYTRLIAYRTMDFLASHRHGRTENLAAEAWQFDLKKDPQLLLHPEQATCFKVLIIASVVCVVLAAWQCASREFHVKTPEKD
jgi:ABC-2 type transport system permease protein